MKREVIATLLMLLPAGAAGQQRFEILGRAIELPAPMQEAAEEGEEECEPRSPWLTPMLATHAALQIGDAHSTRRAIEAGASEGTPLWRWAATSDVRAYSTSAGMAAGVWWGLDRYACKHPRGALWIAIAWNALLGFAVNHNYALGTSLLEGQ